MTQPITPSCQFEFLGMPAIVRSPLMLAVLERVKKVARTNVAVLITGETGTGKELIARALHQFSARSSKPWVDINCCSFPEHLIESELFGYEKGAFSGADRPKAGFFELANGGTLFLDEVGELDLRAQTKLLRVLDGAPYFRLGGVRKIPVDVRVAAATNRDLANEVASGRFRLDLFHRLSQFQIGVPPLRERPEDAIALAEHFLARESPHLSLAPDAIDFITRHSWPGNIRELRNAVTNAALMVNGARIRAADLRTRKADGPATDLNIEAMERKLIVQALSVARGHHQKAAEMLGISVRTLGRKLKAIG